METILKWEQRRATPYFSLLGVEAKAKTPPSSLGVARVNKTSTRALMVLSVDKRTKLLLRGSIPYWLTV